MRCDHRSSGSGSPSPASADAETIIAHLVDVFTVIGSPGYPTGRRELRERLARAVLRAYDPAGTARQMVAVIASGDRRRLLRRITAPTLVIHGSDDETIHPDLGRALFERATVPKRFVLVEGGSHHDTHVVGHALYRDALRELFGLPV